MIQLQLLGSIGLVGQDGSELRAVLAQSKRTGLLAFLALVEPLGFHRRDALLALFWPELGEEEARRALRQALHFLRQHLGPDVIETRGNDDVALSRSTVACDVWSFDRHLAAKEDAAALSYYKGDLLTGFHVAGVAPEFEEWLDRRRAGLGRSALDAARHAAEAAMKEGRPDQAERWARLAVQREEAEDSDLLRLLRLLHTRGNGTAALAAYDGYARRLKEQFAIEPGAPVREFVARIRSEAAAPAVTAGGRQVSDGSGIPIFPAGSAGPATGELVAARYRIERALTRGGNAMVYLAQDLKHSRPVALKILKPRLAAVIGSKRFLREIEIAARLNHPHVLPLYDSGESGSLLYYVMPFVQGETLRDHLLRQGRLPVAEALRLAREVADGLGHAHRLGIVHRDIKPENILLSEGHAVVADFSIAKALTTAGGTRLSESGIPVGTPAYMSPEQARGESEITGRSDVYSLACVVYEMVTGESPFTGSNLTVLSQKSSGRAPDRRPLDGSFPPGMEAVLSRGLAPDPRDRFNTPVELVESLTRAWEGK